VGEDVSSVFRYRMGEVVLRLILLRKCKLNALVIPSPRFRHVLHALCGSGFRRLASGDLKLKRHTFDGRVQHRYRNR